MIEDITEAIPEQWTLQTISSAPAWMGAFTRIAEMLIAVIGCSQETTLFFEVGPGGQLQRVQLEAGLVSYCIFQQGQGAWGTWPSLACGPQPGCGSLQPRVEALGVGV